jgi:uncharacterized repeat protein (TIGR03806 family)
LKAEAKLSIAFLIAAAALGCTRGAPYGLDRRVDTQPFLAMPSHATGIIPPLLSQTGAFRDTAHQIASEGLVPYDLVVAFWSDGAVKSRWMALPEGKIDFSAGGEWHFPAGTVFVKTFSLPTNASDPREMRRLETRLLVRDASGGVYGVVYKWRADGSDADLLTSSETEEIPIKSANGEIHRQTWYYPSRQDCLTCHTERAGGVLGVKTRQLNHDFKYPTGVIDNELRAWNHTGLLEPDLKNLNLRELPTLAAAGDSSRSVEDRARSYLDANCSHCHQPGGTVANFDARYGTPLAQQGLIDGPVLIDQGLDRPRVISPHDIWRSVLYMRANTVSDIRMPPLARETIDVKGMHLLDEWISGMPGRDVLAPPAISPPGGSYRGSVDISLSSAEPGAELRYTLDGSVPGSSDLIYQKPITLKGPAVLRARAFKEGFTRSITQQEVFIVAK